MYKALYLCPMVPSSNLKETVAFFIELFEFKLYFDYGSYAIIYKDNLSLHISQSQEHLTEMEFYLEVDALDELWNAIKHRLPDTRVREPFNQNYGMREFHIELPHTKTIMFVGQNIKE